MTLSPHVCRQFTGAIWRMEIDAKNDVLLMEIRNPDDKSVSFSSINLTSRHVYFTDLSTPERWLTGMECAWDGVLLIHYYQSETGPTHKGMLAVNELTGDTLWSNYSYAFDHLTIKGPIVYDNRIQPRKLFLVDISTGAASRIYEPCIYPEPENYILVPGQLSAELLPPGLVTVHPHGNWVHYIEYNNFRIVSLHSSNQGLLTQHLFVEQNGTLVYEDILTDQIQKLQPEAFIMYKNQLIYIKNTRELKILNL